MSTGIDQAQRLHRKQSQSSGDSIAKVDPTNVDADVQVKDPEKASAAQTEVEEEEEEVSALTRGYRRFRPLVLVALAALILGWWICATILPATRHRWCVLCAGVRSEAGLPRRDALFFLGRHTVLIRSSRLQDRADVLGVVLLDVSASLLRGTRGYVHEIWSSWWEDEEGQPSKVLSAHAT